MNLKSKVFGFAAATALSLSMMSGAMAANTDSVTGSVILAPTYCSVTIDQASVNFGTWQWNGDLAKYVHVSGNNTQLVSGKLTAGHPNGTCDLKVSFDGLKNEDGDKIEATRFSVAGGGQYFDPIHSAVAGALSGGHPVLGAEADSGSANIVLNSVPDTFDPGTYSGTLEVQITKTN